MKRFRTIFPIILTAIFLLYIGHPRGLATDSDEYTIGIEDVLSVSVLGSPELDSTVTVGPDGAVVLPLPIGAIRAEGLTRGQLEETVREILAQYIKGGAHVTVQVTQYNSRKIAVFGEGIRSPGTFSYAKIPPFLEILSRAGGLTPNADQANIRIIPADKEIPVQPVNLEQLLQETHPSWPQLTPGDTVFIPARPPAKLEPSIPGEPSAETSNSEAMPQLAGDTIIHVLGQVNKQGIFRFRTPPSLLSVLAMTVPIQANLPITVTRPNGESIPVDLGKYIATGDATLLPQLQSGDLIYVAAATSNATLQQSVALLGAVNARGNHPISQPMDLNDFLQFAGGLTENANPTKIQVTRETENFIQTKTVNPLDTAFEVQPGDRILVPPRSQSPNAVDSVLGTTFGILNSAFRLIYMYDRIF